MKILSIFLNIRKQNASFCFRPPINETAGILNMIKHLFRKVVRIMSGCAAWPHRSRPIKRNACYVAADSQRLQTADSVCDDAFPLLIFTTISRFCMVKKVPRTG